MTSPVNDGFQLSLVLSGGSTRGAYSAGVLDFLFEAMMEWESAKLRGDKDLPSWSVHIANMVGSSAGAIAETMGAASLTVLHEPMSGKHSAEDEAPKHNLLYRSWVSEFTIDRLFNNSDLPVDDRADSNDTEVRSLLNSNFIKDLMNELTSSTKVNKELPSWACDIELYYTVFNMRGLPYSFEFDKALNKDDARFHLLRHSDYMGFTSSAKKRPGLFTVDMAASRDVPMWQMMMDCTRASAAIPVVFPSVVLSRPLVQYKKPLNYLVPDWPKDMPESYSFNAVDGGTTNNEPLDIGRAALEQKLDRPCETSPQKSWGALLLVDSQHNSSNAVDPSAAIGELSMANCLVGTFSALRRETVLSLKRQELERALDTNDFSQYIISPVREGRREGQPILATETLSDFGGMLDPKIRHHDFMIGRRNCQQFLRKHFRIGVREAAGNPIFSNVGTYASGKGNDGVDGDTVCIIPLVGTAAVECPRPVWPKFSKKERDEIANKVEKHATARIRAVLNTFARDIGVVQAKVWWRVFSNMWQNVLQAIIDLATSKIYDWGKPSVDRALDQFE